MEENIQMYNELLAQKYIDCDEIARCMEWCNDRVSREGNPVLFFDPLALQNVEIETCMAFFWKFFARKNFSFLTARYLFLPINTMNGTHWEVLLVDLKELDIYNFNSLLAHPNDAYYTLCSKSNSFSAVAGALTETSCCAIEDPVARGGSPQVSQEVVSKAIQIVTLYNAYIYFAKKTFNNDTLVPVTETSKTKFNMYVKRFTECQIGNTCGLYVMALACDIARTSGHFALHNEFRYPNAKYIMSKKNIYIYAKEFAQLFTKPIAIPPLEKLENAIICGIYKIFNCITVEGTFGYFNGVMRYSLLIPEETWLGEKDREFVEERFDRIANYFNPEDLLNAGVHRKFKKNLCPSIRFNVIDNEAGLEKEVDSTFNICFAMCKTPNQHGKYKFHITINFPLYTSGLRYFNISIPKGDNVRESFKYSGLL